MAKTINARLQQKHDIEANWKLATNFIPLIGEIIIYDKEDATTSLAGTGRTSPIYYERFKIGDGKTYINDLPFALITEEERETWNAKSNFSGSYNDLTDKPETPNINETQIINDIFSLDELTNPNIGIIYRSNSGSEAGFLNILDAAPIREDSIPELFICEAYGAASGIITYYAKSDAIGTETLTINFNDNAVTGVNVEGTTSTNTLDNYYTDTGYDNLRMIKVEELWAAHCHLDFYTSTYKAVSSDINNVYEGVISPIVTKAYVDTKEFNYATEEDVDYILTTLGLKESLNLITTADGKVLTNNNGVIYIL